MDAVYEYKNQYTDDPEECPRPIAVDGKKERGYIESRKIR